MEGRELSYLQAGEEDPVPPEEQFLGPLEIYEALLQSGNRKYRAPEDPFKGRP